MVGTADTHSGRTGRRNREAAGIKYGRSLLMSMIMTTYVLASVTHRLCTRVTLGNV